MFIIGSWGWAWYQKTEWGCVHWQGLSVTDSLTLLLYIYSQSISNLLDRPTKISFLSPSSIILVDEKAVGPNIKTTIKIHLEQYWNWILTPWNAIKLWRFPPLLYNNIKTEIGHLLSELRVKTQNWRLHLSKSTDCSRGNMPVWKKIIYQLIKLSGFTVSHMDIKK